ncbi:hypothetical protein TCDM_12340 [Trypanosoma cruzi Dm28c]|uniref:Uncharacterized protein n=1 Tax=Trypanosoma cruzi Dm28c TaxID=1416333 RepID=V5AUR8_TRYCR|nr:hypothetical protein TCDM_12340 [Trypanosoma cruzi Dm28c]
MLLFRIVVVAVMIPLAIPVILTPLVRVLEALPVDPFGHLQRHRRPLFVFEDSFRAEFPEVKKVVQLVHHSRHRTTADTAPQHAEGTHQQHTASHHHHGCTHGLGREKERRMRRTHTHTSAAWKRRSSICMRVAVMSMGDACTQEEQATMKHRTARHTTPWHVKPTRSCPQSGRERGRNSTARTQ